MNFNEESKHIYPIDPAEIKTKSPLNKSAEKTQKLNMTNIGQILFICFLFAVIFIQTANIVSNAHSSASGEAYSDDKNSYGVNNNAAPL